jgi:MFS family permease
VQRIGSFLGPFLGAAAMHFAGTDGAYWLHIGAAAAGAALLLLLPDVSGRAARRASTDITTVRSVVRDHSRVLRTLGSGVMVLGAVRAARLAVIPLWGERIGLSASTIAVLFGLSSAVDMLLFYPAGKVMDRYGRVWVAVPCLLLMALGLLLVPLTTSAVGLGLVGAVMGLGNGMGSGVGMVLGSDASPPEGRAAFLGVWRLCPDVGTSVGPLLLGAIAALAGLAPGVLALGGLGLVGAGAMHRWVPRPTSGAAPSG